MIETAWPHKPAAFDFHATKGHSWRLTVGGGARSTRISAPGTTPVAAADEGPKRGWRLRSRHGR
ncbi:hypothetical protein [Streptomyces adustus]|uniref:hypothetical protein n=1 Tax=Streptomyces adustus TaxID=1609272 RepID=UPI00371B969C